MTKPLNIVFLAPFGIRPKGTLLARMLPLAVALQERGHRVTIIAPPYTNPEDAGRDETVRGVTLRNVRLGPGGKAMSAPFIAWRMYRAAMAEQPDLVHLFKPKGYGGLAAMLMIVCASLGSRMPKIVVDSDDWEGEGGMNDLLPYSAMERTVFAFQEKWLLQRASAITVASRFLDRTVRERIRPHGEMLYLPNGVADDTPGNGGIIRKRFGIGDDIPVVLLYTRFFEFDQKRLHEVFANVFTAVPAVRFFVVGAGRNGEEKQLMEAAGQLGFTAALIMAGWVEPGELKDYLAVGDVAVYPFDDTMINRCKCPAKLTEILMAGLATVADRVGQISEYLVHEKGGILCSSGDSTAMANGLISLLNNRDSRAAMAAFNRRFIRESFSWATMVTGLEDLYASLTHGKEEPSPRSVLPNSVSK